MVNLGGVSEKAAARWPRDQTGCTGRLPGANARKLECERRILGKGSIVDKQRLEKNGSLSGMLTQCRQLQLYLFVW